MDEQEFFRLIDGACDATLSAEEINRLREHMCESDQALRQFVQRMDLHGQLQWELGVGLPSVVSDLIPDVSAVIQDEATVQKSNVLEKYHLEDSRPQRTSGRQVGNNVESTAFPFQGVIGYGRWVAAVAALLVAAVLIWEWKRTDGIATPVASVVASQSCVFLDPDAALAAGDSVGDQSIDLTRGLLQLQIGPAAVLTAEGPVKFSVVGANQVRLDSGRVVVKLAGEAAKPNFSVVTPNCTVVDLGTEFGVQHSGHFNSGDQQRNDLALGDLGSIIQVFEGSVEVNVNGTLGSSSGPFDAKMVSAMQAGESVRVDEEGRIEPYGFSDARFARALPPNTSLESRQHLNWNSDASSAINVAPFGAPPKIDGVLGEWELTDSVMLSHRKSNRSEFAEVFLRYDINNLYIAAVVGDPYGMRNRFTPADSSPYAWTGGGIQLSLKREVDSPEKTSVILMWHAASFGQAALSLRTGDGQFIQRLVNASSNQDESIGRLVSSFSRRAYTLEYAIPWSEIGRPAPVSGENCQAGITVFWSDPAGRHWRGQMTSGGDSVNQITAEFVSMDMAISGKK